MTAAPSRKELPLARADQLDPDPLVVPRVTLPKNLEAILTRLSHDELSSLQTHVEAEIRRRAPERPRAASKALSQSRAKPTSLESVPVAKRSLILASSRAGMKPQAIAKTLRLSLSLVNRVLAEQAKS